jgi:hypothetical protein
MDAQPERCVQNLRLGGHDNWEGHNLDPKGLGPKASGSGVRDTWLPSCFWTPNDVIRYTTEELLDITAQYASNEEAAGLSLSQATGKRSLASAERCHPMSPSQAPRRVPRVVKRGESGALGGLQLLSAAMTTMTR